MQSVAIPVWRHAPVRLAAAIVLLAGLAGPALAQLQGGPGGPGAAQLAPATTPGGAAPRASGSSVFGPPGASLVAPGARSGTLTPHGVPASPGIPSLLPSSPSPFGPSQLVPGPVRLAVSARFGRDAPVIGGGLRWRVFEDKPDKNGAFHLIREDQNSAPTFTLPPGSYIVHVDLGLASAAKRVRLRGDTVREVFDIQAGGLKLKGQVGNDDIPASQISFDILSGSQFEPGEKQRIAAQVMTGDVVIVPEGTYNIISNYGDANAVVRSDIRVRAGKLTDVTVTHQAAIITLKLVNDRGGEALANTAWSVLTPGGDVIKESIGAFPRVILAEGDYRVIARNEGKVFEREFKVSSGVDGEVEVVAR